MNHDLIVFIVSLMNILVKDRLMRVFFDKRKTSLPVYSLGFMYYVALINIFSLLRIQNASIPIWFTTYIILSLNFDGSWKKRIAAAISLVGLGVIVDLAIIMSLGIYYTTFSGENLIHNDLSMILYGLIGFLVAVVLNRFKNINKNVNVSTKEHGFILAIPIASVILMFIVAAHADMPAPASLLTGILIFGINVLVFYLHDSLTAAHEKLLKSALHAQEKEYYLTQCRLMQESTDRATASRHDMKIHMAALKGYVTNNKTDNAAAYIDRFLGDISESRLYSKTGNLALDSIINYKLKDIKNSEFVPKLRLNIPPTLSIDDSDIVTIIGNLLDNAIEAIAKTDTKTLELNVVLNKGTLLIKSENSFNGEINHNHASLKDGEEHGHGLNNVKRSVDKYDGYIKISHNDNLFSVNIMLYA
ncbi:MAG: GHKL domain-containing protein [Defluviitaleaceae bacterium]|nr:GHKL domain-containing protein [Defluviitaleaceae bacterium]